MATRLIPRRFTVEEFHRMGRAGLFDEDDRVELIGGEIVSMTPIGRRHVACVNRLVALFHKHFLGRFIVSSQNPLRLSEKSEPQPDLAVLAFRPDFYASRAAMAEDALLVVEVGESSAALDRNLKAGLYARHGVPEYWIVDLTEGLVESHADPSPRGYRRVRRYGPGESVEWNGEQFPVDEMLVKWRTPDRT